MPSTLAGNLHCPREHTNNIAQQCVAKYITANTCKAAGGRWTKFITNIVERTSRILSTCHAMGDMRLKRGIPYQPHKVSQGADEPVQYVLVQKPPDVIYAPSTVVNHNGINMEGKTLFASCKEIGIAGSSGKFLFVESGILIFVIRNPDLWNPEYSSRNPESY